MTRQKKAELEAALDEALRQDDHQQVAVLEDKLRNLAKYEIDGVIGAMLATL